MRAHQIVASQQPAELREVPRPEPGPGQVLVRVGGAGLCHSDLHMMHWPMAAPGPFTLGHETAGWIEELGAGVVGFEIDEPVIVHGPWGCGYCRRCQADMEQFCENAGALGMRPEGLGADGGLADYLLVPAARHLVPIGDLDPAVWAPLDDAVLTPYHALKRVQHLCTPDNWAMVIGIGGLGHSAVQLIKELTGARVLAVDVNDDKLEHASALGADATLRGDTPDAATVVKEITGGRGVAAVLDCVGADATMQLAAQTAHPVSHVIVVGIAGGTLPFSFLSVPFETAISTTYWGGLTELREVVALAQAGRITLDVEQIELEGAAEAYERLERGEVKGRVVAVPNKS
jgi:propanol-preferring alcohol dehydrogenase